MPLLVCDVGWMSRYEGLEGKPDKIVGGGRWIQDNDFGGEVCNFLPSKDGNIYGYFETAKKDVDRPVSIGLLGAREDDESVGGVDVIWTATHPQERGRRVVGWYRDALVFRERQKFQRMPSPQHKRDELKDFRVQVKATHATLLPLEERTVTLGHGHGWIGQANWWFPEESSNPAVKPFLQMARALMNGSAGPLRPGGRAGKGGWGGSKDPERNAEVERAAITFVKGHYADYSIKSVEDENLGWDLEALAKGKLALCLEVKGRFSTELKVGLTPREYLALSNHLEGKMPNYRLCVVTGALSENPRLIIFQYQPETRGWIDECTKCRVSPDIREFEAAIVSLG